MGDFTRWVGRFCLKNPVRGKVAEIEKGEQIKSTSSPPILLGLLAVYLVGGFSVLILTNFSPISVSRAPEVGHGDKQVTDMLSDRPAMRQFVSIDGDVIKISPDSKIWGWAAKKYEWDSSEAAIYWDRQPGDKPDHYLADHSSPFVGAKGVIRIREWFRDSRGEYRAASFEELWAACVFELINIRNGKKFNEVFDRALRGEVQREQWVRINTGLEHQALLKLKVFFRDVWGPWAVENRYEYDQNLWGGNVSNDYLKWISRYREHPEGNNYTFWEDYYDLELAPYLNSQRIFR